jgi:TolB protein
VNPTRLLLLSALVLLAAPAAADEGRHLKNLKQLTTVGKNGEGYFSPDGKQIIFQSIRGESPYYQMFVMNADGSGQRMVSSGRGKTTCGWFVPGGITFASTHLDPSAFQPGRDKAPPQSPSRRYLWDFDSAMDVFQTDLQGKNERRLTTTPGYDAEASWSWDGKQMVFTSERSGDLEIWIAGADGKDARRLTWATGYDGGPFFSPDGKLVVFRGFRGADGRAAEVYVVGADGRGERQLTKLGAVSWAPYFHPDGKRIIFTTNWKGAHPGDFDLYLMRVDGSGLERVTTTPGFDGLPSFSRDGKKLVWTSNRVGNQSQVFVADWID